MSDPWSSAGAVALSADAPEPSAPADAWTAAGAIPASAGKVPAQATAPEIASPAAPADAGPPTPSFVDNLLAPGKQAIADLRADFGKSWQAAKDNQTAGPLDFGPTVRGVGADAAVIKDVGALALSPISGAFNAAVVQPGADLLDQIPLPSYTSPTISFDGGPHIVQPRRMTDAEKHAANADAINTALMALGPKGIKAGSVAQTGAAVADANAAKYTAKVANVVSAVPPEVALDPSGNLTPEAQEHAVRAGVHPEDLKTGYQAAQQSQAAQARAAQAHEAATQAEAEAQAAGEQAAQHAPGTQEAADAHQIAADKQAAAVQARTAADEASASAPAPQPVQAGPGATGEPSGPMPDEGAPATAQDRLAEAKSEGVDLSQGQATQDFETQAKENDLRGTSGAANEFFAKQQQQIGEAADQFRQAFGDPEMSAADRGQMVKDAIGQLRDSGKAGVTALYQKARDLAQSMGAAGSNLINLDTQPLLEGMRQLWSDESVPDRVRAALKQQAARYGLIGENPQAVEGETTVTLRDSKGQPAGKISFVGQREPLTILNAEDLRQKINQLYMADDTKQSQALKGLIDDAVQQAVERAASNDNADIGKAFKDARAAYVQQKQTFQAKDIIQNLIDWKKGTEVRDASGKVVGGTPTILPEDAPRKVLAGGKEAETNLRKIKALLLSKPTPESAAAWQAIKSQAVEDIFNQATVTNANLGGGQVGAISGAKLNTAISTFGVGKLKILLDEGEFNQLMKLRRIIETATVPISGTTNPSGAGHLVARFLQSHGLGMVGKVVKFIPGMRELQHVGEAAHGLYKVGKEHAEADKTLKGIREFDAKAAAALDKKKR